MRAGKLRARLVFEVPTQSQDSYGEEGQTWVVHAERRGSLSPISGAEARETRGETARIRYEIWCRYVAGVTEKMRVVVEGKHYDILAILDIGSRRRKLKIMAEYVGN